MLTGLSNSADTALTLRIVRALRNAGLQATKEKLIEIAESSKETALTVAAIQALASINKDYPTKNVSMSNPTAITTLTSQHFIGMNKSCV